MEDLSVSLEDNQLVIRGRNGGDDSGKVYLHRGIATRQFQRSFVLAEGIEVIGANLDDGLLHIELERMVPEPEVRTIEIETRGGRGKGSAKRSATIDVESDV